MSLHYFSSNAQMPYEDSFFGNVKPSLYLHLVFNRHYRSVRSRYPVAHAPGQTIAPGIKNTYRVKISQELVIYFICSVGPEHPARMYLSGIINRKLLLVLHFPYSCKQVFFPVGYDHVCPQAHILSFFRVNVASDSCSGFCDLKRFYTCSNDTKCFIGVLRIGANFFRNFIFFEAKTLLNSCFHSPYSNFSVFVF